MKVGDYMADILNDIYDEEIKYSDEKINDDQFHSDESTMTTVDEQIYGTFMQEANNYYSKVAKNKFYDFKTSNKSFLTLYNDLYKLGIKNNKFFLRLYDKDLQCVNPYGKFLPKEMQLKIIMECMINPWYWLREVLRIPVDGLPIEIGGGVQYRIDRNNLACWYLFLNGIDHYQSKPRQQGKTQDCVAKFNYAYHFANRSSYIQFFNKDQDQANMNLYRLKCQRDMLPSWMQMKTIVIDDGKVDKGVDNTKSIRNPVTGNIIMTMSKATSKESAMKIGRGATAALQYYDEFDFIPYQTEIMNSATFAFSTAAENARKNGALAIRILSSTPGDLDMRDGKSATEYVSHMLRWDDTMLDMPISELKRILHSPSYNRFVYVEHTWRQLKLPMEWYETQCALVSYDAEVIMREIDLKRIHGSSASPFKRSDIMYIMNHQATPILKIDYSKNLCPIMIYEKIKLNKVYIMGIDPSEGLSQDNNAMTLINPSTQKPVAEFRSPYISQPDLCRLMIKFLDEYCPRSMIVIENNKGRELINCFLETKYKYQLYYDDGKLLDKVIEKTDPYGALKRASMERRAYGIYTSASNRVQYFAILENIMEERKDLLTTPYIVEDVCGLIRKVNGRIEAGEGSHDDNIFSYLLGLFVYIHSPYEKLEQYGIRRGQLDSDINDYDEKGNITEAGTMRQLNSVIDQLPDDLKELVKNASKQKDELTDARDFQREVQRYRNSTGNPMFSNNDNGFETIIPTNGPMEESFWTDYDNQVWSSNYENEDDKSNNQFDIDDFL